MIPALPPLVTSAAILAQVLAIDLMLAADNAVVVGMVVARLPAPQRRAAILGGVAIAVLLRAALALAALRLLRIVGVLFAGGLLLLWVCWHLYRELREAEPAAAAPAKSLPAAIAQIVLADLSMSLDNVLAVAGAARGHPLVLLIGLAIAVLLMGVAAEAVARLLARSRALAWIGLAMVLFVALRLTWEGAAQLRPFF